MKKIVINNCFGGFSLSKEAYDFLGLDWDGFGFKFSGDRENPRLIECVETLGKKASGSCADLIIEEYDDENYDAYIDEYDGAEDLELIPVVNENRLRTCKDINEIMDYLESIDVRVRRESDKNE